MPGSEVLFPFEVAHLARGRLASAPISKGLFSQCVENVSRYEFLSAYTRFVLFLREMLAINISGASMKPSQLFRRDPFLEMVSAHC